MKYVSLLLLFIFSFLSFAQIDFLPYQRIVTGSRPIALCVADLNNDGLNDVVVGLGGQFDPVNDFRIKVFLQQPNGSLGNPIEYPYPDAYPALTGLDVADLNNDNLNDVVISYGDSIGIFTQNNSGSFNPIESYYSGGHTSTVKAGDINNDGLVDIVTCHKDTNFIKVFYKSASGYNTDTLAKLHGESPEIEIGDVNGDGLNDVVCMNGSHHIGLFIYTQSANGNLKPYTRYLSSQTISGPNGIDIADLNLDGYLDIIETKGGNGSWAKVVLWHQDTSTGLLATPIELQSLDNPSPTEVGDLDCDGRPEIVTVNGGFSDITVFEMDSSNQFSTYKNWFVYNQGHYYTQGLDVGDINSDGKQDVVIADSQRGLMIMYNNSKPKHHEYTVTSTANLIDTIYSNSYQTSSYFYTNSIDTVNFHVIKTTDSLKITKYFFEDSVRFDTLIYKIGYLCNETFHDTTITTFKKYRNLHLSTDTSYFSSKKDTIEIIERPKLPTGGIAIYPNPVISELTIELTYDLSPLPLLLQIHDIKGSLVYEHSINNKESMKKVDLSLLPKDHYMIRVTVGNISITEKLTKN